MSRSFTILSMKKKILLILLAGSTTLLSACNLEGGLPINSNSQQTSSSSSSNSSGSFSSEEEEGWVYFNVENDDAQEKTIKNLISANGTSSNNKVLYRITGIVQCIKNTSYGNFDLLDDTGFIHVYGCAKSNYSISKSGDTYSYSSSTKFNEMNIKPGDKIVMEGLYSYYTGSGGISQFNGYCVSLKRNGESTEAFKAKSYDTAEPTNAAGNYYSSIDSSDSGSALMTKLHNLMDTTHTNYITYDSLFNHYKNSDAYPNGNVKCFYSGTNAYNKSYNREHVWAQSLSNSLFGTDHAGSDLHHVRPAKSEYNSMRSNAVFGPIFGAKTGANKIAYEKGGSCYGTRYVFEPADAIKGDVARIIMYVYVHYSTGAGGNSQSYYGPLYFSSIMGSLNSTECISLLRKWNAEDPVSQDEITRNNYAYSVQNNRNPFIDHPKYADRIWG